MKQLFFLFLLATGLFTTQACNKSKKECFECDKQVNDTSDDIEINVHDTIWIDNTNNNNNNNNNGGNQPPRDTTRPNTDNNNNGNTNPPPVVDNNYYISGVTVPNASTNSHEVGATYWGFTSKPDACAWSNKPESCNMVAIRIDAKVWQIDGSYVYEWHALPSVTYFGQNNVMPYLKADTNGGSSTKNALSNAFNLQQFPFVTAY